MTFKTVCWFSLSREGNGLLSDGLPLWVAVSCLSCFLWSFSSFGFQFKCVPVVSCCSVAASSSRNQMTQDNLAIVFAPTVVGYDIPDPTPAASLQAVPHQRHVRQPSADLCWGRLTALPSCCHHLFFLWFSVPAFLLLANLFFMFCLGLVSLLVLVFVLVFLCKSKCLLSAIAMILAWLLFACFCLHPIPGNELPHPGRRAVLDICAEQP